MLRFALRLAVIVAATVLLPRLHAQTLDLPANVMARVIAPVGPATVNAPATAGPAQTLRFAGLDLGTQPRATGVALRRLIPAGRARDAVAASGCTTPVCAADAVFGPGIGARLLELHVRYGFNGSHLGRDGVRAWTADELDAVLAAAADVPLASQEGERPLLRDDRLDRYRTVLAISDTAQTLIAINGSGDVGLRFGPAWAAMPAAQRRAAALHELAHELARTRGKTEGWTQGWSDAVIADAFLARRAGLPTSRVSRYAMTNLAEDFAESVVAYRYAPELLKTRAPNRMRFLRDLVFKEAGPLGGAQSAQAASSM